MYAFSRLKKWTASREIKTYLENTRRPKINIGCGRNQLVGWLNVDLYPFPGDVRIDACKKWPFLNDTFDAAFCEHMIEHVPKEYAKILLSEAYRTLKPGGVIRIVTPDCTEFAKFLLGERAEECEEYLAGLSVFLGSPLSICDAINEIFYSHGHRYIYSPDELLDLMKFAGFSGFRLMRGGQYKSPVFCGVDGHPKVIGRRINQLEAFAVEAYKSK
jgi:SAM-dependent methyltransferase